MFTNQTILSDNSGNELRFSSVSKFNDKVHFKNFSVKYVIEGEENYSINQKRYCVKKGEFVVGNQHSFSSILIDSPHPVKGICIDISEQKLLEIIHYHLDDSVPFESYLFTDELLNKKFQANNTSLGVKLEQLGKKIQSALEPPVLSANDLFYSLADSIVADQMQLYSQYSKLKFCKQETNKRLFSFILEATHNIDAHFTEKMQIVDLAKSASLSEYHFIRLFKSVNGVTPHQYIIQKRLAFSKILLSDNCSVSEAAFQSGFSDVYSFSKSFKAAYGYSPTLFKNSN